MMCYVCHQQGMGIKPDDIFASDFCSKLVIYVIMCKRCFPVYVHNVRYACLCGVKWMLSGLFFYMPECSVTQFRSWRML